MKGCKYFPSYKAKTSCNEQKCYSKGECVQVTKLINGESICVPYKSNSDDNCTNPLLNPDGLWDEIDMCAVVGVVDTNTVNVSLVYDPVSQNIILTDSDGNMLTEDVSALVSPPDVDFAFTTVDILGTQVTITYFDSNGDLITNSVFTLPDVVDNGDGTFTYNGITWATDDDITAVAFVANGTNLEVTVEEGATSFTGTLPILDVANALCADPNASAVLKACVDTNATNTTLVLGANNVLTLTDTDGNTVTEDLSGLISPPDIDFASTTEALDNNGDLVITYLDANGVIIDTSIVPISSITTVTNADGSVTYTHSDGTSWTVAPDTFATTTYAQNTDADGVTTTTITMTPADGGPDVVTTISTRPCVNEHPTFIARCNASAGTGSPIDRYIIDASLTTGDKVIEFLPLGDYSAPTNDDPWIFVTNNDVGFITDTQFLTQGGYIRVGVETDCGTKWDIQKFEPCCDDVEGDVVKGSLVGVASFCLGVEVSPTSSYIQLDEYISPLTPDKTMPYLGGSITNTSNCTKCYTAKVNTNVNRANELGALGGPFAGIPDAIATVQTRLGFVGDPLLDDPFADILYFTTNSTIWDSVERDIEEETSGRIKNSYYQITGVAPNEGVSTFNKNELDFCLAPGETADLEAKTHIYYWEDEDGEVPVSQERIHFEGNMFITERT